MIVTIELIQNFAGGVASTSGFLNSLYLEFIVHYNFQH